MRDARVEREKEVLDVELVEARAEKDMEEQLVALWLALALAEIVGLPVDVRDVREERLPLALEVGVRDTTLLRVNDPELVDDIELCVAVTFALVDDVALRRGELETVAVADSEGVTESDVVAQYDAADEREGLYVPVLVRDTAVERVGLRETVLQVEVVADAVPLICAEALESAVSVLEGQRVALTDALREDEGLRVGDSDEDCVTVPETDGVELNDLDGDALLDGVRDDERLAEGERVYDEEADGEVEAEGDGEADGAGDGSPLAEGDAESSVADGTPLAEGKGESSGVRDGDAEAEGESDSRSSVRGRTRCATARGTSSPPATRSRHRRASKRGGEQGAQLICSRRR